VLIDLCAGPLAPWLAVIIAKVKEIDFLITCFFFWSCRVFLQQYETRLERCLDNSKVTLMT
jgi:hypothetical protein